MSNIIEFLGGAKITTTERERLAQWLTTKPGLSCEAIATDDGRDVLCLWRGDELQSYSLARFGAVLVILSAAAQVVAEVRSLDAALEVLGRLL